MQLIGGLDVRDLLKERHQFRQIKELGEPCSCAIASSFGRKLDGRRGFTEGRSPAVKVRHMIALQRVVLQIALHGVQLRHTVGNRRTRGKHNAAPAR